MVSCVYVHHIDTQAIPQARQVGSVYASTWWRAPESNVKTTHLTGRAPCATMSERLENEARSSVCTVVGLTFHSLCAIIQGMEKGRGANRSEERRVGKQCRSRWSTYHEKKKQ